MPLNDETKDDVGVDSIVSKYMFIKATQNFPFTYGLIVLDKIKEKTHALKRFSIL